VVFEQLPGLLPEDLAACRIDVDEPDVLVNEPNAVGGVDDACTSVCCTTSSSSAMCVTPIVSAARSAPPAWSHHAQRCATDPSEAAYTTCPRQPPLAVRSCARRGRASRVPAPATSVPPGAASCAEQGHLSHAGVVTLQRTVAVACGTLMNGAGARAPCAESLRGRLRSAASAPAAGPQTCAVWSAQSDAVWQRVRS